MGQLQQKLELLLPKVQHCERSSSRKNGGSWIFGKRGDGYVALCFDQPNKWMESNPDAGQEIIALGNQNVFIVQVGRKSTAMV